MVSAAGNFSHKVASKRQPDHILVTTGIYGVFRHPSYFGFFWWGLGMQVLLLNPICLVTHGFVLYRFFRSRIYEEEKLLVLFFGQDYVKYKENTPSGVPFVS